MTKSIHAEAQCDVCKNFTECQMYPGKEEGADNIPICDLCTHNESIEDEPIKVTKLPPLEKKSRTLLTDADIINQIDKTKQQEIAKNKTYTFTVPNLASDIQHQIANEFLAACRYVLDKNKAHKDTARNPICIFSKASPLEQLNAHIDSKLAQLISGNWSDEIEHDLIGYLILRRIVKMESKVETSK